MDHMIKRLKEIPTYDLGDILLRKVELADVLDMYEYGSDEMVTKYLSWGPMKSPSEAEQAIKNIFLFRPDHMLPAAHAIVDKKTNKMIGTCDFISVDWTKKIATLGYVLNRDFWGKGYMTKVVKTIISFAFDYLKIDTIIVQHHPKNIGSKKVILKAGFTYLEERYNKTLDLVLPTYILTK